MPWTNFPAAPGDDIQTGAYIDLSSAFHERGVAVDNLDPGGFITYGSYAIVGNPGDDVQYASGSSTGYTWPGSSSSVPTQFGWREWQKFGDAVCIAFLDTGYIGHVADPGFDFADYLLDEAGYRTAATIDPAGNVRTYWRTIDTLADTVDQEGDAYAATDQALSTADGLVYEYAGAGAWTLLGQVTPTRRPDTATKQGYVERGDIIQSAAWANEIYRGFGVLQESYVEPSIDDGHLNGVFGTPFATVVAAEADSQSQWDANETSGGIGSFMAIARLTSTTPAPLYLLDLQGQRGRLTHTLPVAVETTIDFYAFAEDSSGTFSGTNQTFDDQGFGLTQDAWASFDSIGPAFQTAVNSAYLGKTASGDYPTTPATPAGAPVSSEVQGFIVSDTAAVVHWHFDRP